MECVVCKTDFSEEKLTKCPMCFKFFCNACQHLWQGRYFCTKRCAEAFFFGDE